MYLCQVPLTIKSKICDQFQIFELEEDMQVELILVKDIKTLSDFLDAGIVQVCKWN